MVDDDVGAALRDAIVAAAQQQRTITYEELLQSVDERTRVAAAADLAAHLRALSEAEDEAGRGLLTAIVVRGDTGLPGRGWFGLAFDRGRDVPRLGHRGVWEHEVEAVFAVWRRQ